MPRSLPATKAWPVLLVGLLLTAPATAVQTVVQAPAEPARAGTTLSLTVFFHNPADSEATFTPPASIRANWLQRGRRYPVTLQAADTPTARTIAPRSHIQRRYSADLPAEVANGPLKLRLTDRAAEPLTLLARAAPESESTVTAHRADTPLMTPAAANADEDTLRNSFLDNFFAYEPLYFLAGAEPANAKFQISFKYRFIDADSELARDNRWVQGFYLAYTQTSFWDLSEESFPFDDTNFRPELFYQFNDVEWPLLSSDFHSDLRIGYLHESNGQSGEDSRSRNIAYIEPAFHWRVNDATRLSLAPRAWTYIGTPTGNPDIRRFHGRARLTATLSRDESWQLEAMLRGNPSTGKGAVQFDLTYPLNRVTFSNLDFYLHAQLFSGYGENLLNYNVADTSFRLGLGIVR